MGNPALRDGSHQDPLDLRMTVKGEAASSGIPEPYSVPPRDPGFPREAAGRMSSSSPDSNRSPPQEHVQHPLTPTPLYPMDKAYVSRGPSSSTASESMVFEDHSKELSSEFRDSPKNGSERIGAAVRPFKMYPNIDPLMYGSMMGSPVSSVGSPGSLTPMGLPPLYDTAPGPASPGSSSFSLGLSPMVSYVMQKRRRHEARERDNKEKEQAASRSPPPATATSASPAPASLSSDEDRDAKKPKIVPEEKKDDAYWERRRKNNEAAKRSRDARRQKEEEIAMRAAFLEQENLKLRAQVAILKNETAKLHYLLYNRATV